jgi:hypothetical protein
MGLGRAMGEMFAEAGAAVVLVARRAEPLEAARAAIAAKGGDVLAVAADVATADGCRAAHAAAVERFGRVDILVNNAGKSATAPFETIDDQAWQDDLDLKLFAAIRLTRLAFPEMKARGWGRVVNVLNTHAKAPGPRSAPTSVSRAAGLALTKVLAQEGAPHNVGERPAGRPDRQRPVDPAARRVRLQPDHAEFLADKGRPSHGSRRALGRVRVGRLPAGFGRRRLRHRHRHQRRRGRCPITWSIRARLAKSPAVRRRIWCEIIQ